MKFKTCRGFAEVATVFGLAISPAAVFASGPIYDQSWMPPEPDEKEEAVNQEGEAEAKKTIIPIVKVNDVPRHALLRELAAERRKTSYPREREEQPARKEQVPFIAMMAERFDARQNKRKLRFQIDAFGNPSVILRWSRGKPIVRTGNGHYRHVS